MDVQTDSGPEPAFEMSCSKTACDWCRKRRVAGVTLKQCAGCKVAWYCSKPCQVAAWPVHKSTCKSRSRDVVPAAYAPLGCATMAELMHQTLLWLRAHDFTLTIMANALVELGGGVDVALDPDTPRVVVFNLGAPSAYDGTPATAFTLKSLRLEDPRNASNAGADPQWSREMVALRKLAALTLSSAGVDSVLASMIPIIAYLSDAQWGTSPQTSFPLCRPQRATGEVLDERTRGTLRNVMRMCTGGINGGVVLHMPEDPHRVVPDMGKVVLEGKDQWTWAPHDRSVLVGPPGPDGVPGKGLAYEFLRYFDSKLSPDPVDCFETYHRLWPYHLIRDAAKRVVEVYPGLAPYTRRR